MHVAAFQMRSTTSVADNVAALEAGISEAAARGATYVQTPEMTGLVQRHPKQLHEAVTDEASDPVFASASDLAKQLGIWIHIGSTPIKTPDGKVANRAGIFAPDGTKAAIYDKIHMFDVDLDNGESWRESAVYASGNTIGMAEINGIRVGLAICYDLRFPHLFRDQALAGAKILTVPAAFTRQTGEAHWHVLLRARAIETGSYVIAAAQGGNHADGRETYGHSVIIDPWGKIIAEKADDEPGVIDAVIDLSAVDMARKKIPNLQHAVAYEGASA